MTDEHLRILFLAHYYPPEMGGAAARLHGLARWLALFGHEVTVITGKPNYPSGVIPPEYRGGRKSREEVEGVQVLRTWIYASSSRSSIHRLANYFSFVLSSIVRGITYRRRFDILVASSPPLFIGISGWILAKWYRIPWVLDVRDVWPEVAVEVGAFTADAAITKWGHRLAKFLYQRAAHITLVTENQHPKLLAAGVPPEKISLIPNGVDLDVFSQAPEVDWRGELGLEARLLVTYTGLMGIAQGVEIIVEVADRLRDRPDIHFLLVGDGVRRAEIVWQADLLNLENITFLPVQPRELVPSILRAGDVTWVPIATDRLLDARPSKMLEAWACRKAVILSASGEAADLVRESGGGVVVPPADPDRLVEAIVALQSNPQLLRSLGDNGYHFVEKRFQRQKLARQMEQILVGLVGRSIS
jgi:colanic acid biosynthesis glycosyl transferase WcaI